MEPHTIKLLGYVTGIISVHGKNGLGWPNWGWEDFFLLIQTLPTFWSERIWILIICFPFLGLHIFLGPHRVNRAHWPTKENKQKIKHVFGFFGPWEKLAWDGSKWGRESLFPANSDLADILGDMDVDFENFHF